MQSESILSNNVMLDVLQRLYFSEAKPAQITPLDLSVLTYLILRRSVDHEIRDSYNTIAERLGAERRTIPRSLKRLESVGWISVSGKGRGNTQGISINFETFPAAQPIREKISDAAIKLSQRYMQALIKTGRKKFPKNWASRQRPSAQHILTLCGGDFDLACKVIGKALSLPKFKKRAGTSLYLIKSYWKPIYQAYLDSKVKAEPTNQEGEPNEQCSAAA